MEPSVAIIFATPDSPIHRHQIFSLIPLLWGVPHDIELLLIPLHPVCHHVPLPLQQVDWKNLRNKILSHLDPRKLP